VEEELEELHRMRHDLCNRREDVVSTSCLRDFRQHRNAHQGLDSVAGLQSAKPVAAAVMVQEGPVVLVAKVDSDADDLNTADDTGFRKEHVLPQVAVGGHFDAASDDSRTAPP
jgi:hypothetical protein